MFRSSAMYFKLSELKKIVLDLEKNANELGELYITPKGTTHPGPFGQTSSCFEFVVTGCHLTHSLPAVSLRSNGIAEVIEVRKLF